MSTIATKASPICLTLIAKGLVGSKHRTLEDESGHFTIKFPVQL